MFSLTKPTAPALRLSTLLTAGLSLSIGWGIRGNFGHQHGAAFAGCLGAICVCLLSGRQDWHNKVLYFAFFGSIGWGFGATISYMQVIGYTESGHLPSQLYGYGCLFLIGFLWAALGTAGTALAAAADKDRLSAFFKPILFVFAAWLLLDLIEDPVAALIQPAAKFDGTWERHKNPLYWFDANYLPAFFALLAAGVYDLTDRREKNGWWLPVYGIGGALAGAAIQFLLRTAGWENRLASALTYTLGDPSYTNPQTGAPAFDPANFLNNWPQWFNDYPQHIGWVIGLVAGITFYFLRMGKFRQGSSLIVYMAAGWLIFFLAFPVLGSLFFTKFGGIRMTPPRSDDWAGITGVFAGTILWLRRNDYLSVAWASVIGGTIGGLGFSGIQWIKQVMMAPGNPRILAAKGILPGSPAYESTVAAWANWQHQNWHSFLEQSYGFVNGIAVAVALGWLAIRLPMQTNAQTQWLQMDRSGGKPLEKGGLKESGRWTLAAAAIFVLLVIPYVNLLKNVDSWSNQLKPEIWLQTITGPDGSVQSVPAQWDFPYIGRLPGVHFLHLSPEGWFDLTWLLMLGCFIVLLRRHMRKPLTLVPADWAGKGQLLFLILLWVMVIGNFERALPGWSPSRLLTEWVITVNAILTTGLILLLPGNQANAPEMVLTGNDAYRGLYKRSWVWAVSVVLVASVFFTLSNRLIYQYPPYDQMDIKHIQTRFGPDANWRTKPILKNAEHK